MTITKSSGKNVSFVEGSIWDKLIMFVLPLAATSILQQLFNSADMAVVGQFAGKKALAAVGNTSAFVNLMIEIFVGFSMGANVIVARFIGNGDMKKADTAVHTSVAFAILIGFFIGIIGIFIAKPMLYIMNVPEDIVELSAVYLRIYFAGMPFLTLYNFCAAILRSRGNTKVPFYALLFAGAVNVVLNLFFVTVLKMDVAGVAIATVISNAVSAGILIYFIMYKDDMFKLEIRKLRIDKSILISFVKIGLPSSFLGSVFSISNVCVQSAINSLGTDAVSASAAASNVEIYIQFFGNAFAQATATFVSQNYGAGKHDRCKKALYTSLAMCIAVTVVISFIVFVFGRSLLKIFTTDALVIEIAMTRMKYTVLFKFIQCIMDIMVGCLQGYGYTFVPALISIFGVCGVRLLWIYTVFPMYKTLESIMVIYPITQGIASISHSVCYFMFQRRKIKE